MNDKLSPPPHKCMQKEHAGVCSDLEFFPPSRCQVPTSSQEQLAILEECSQLDSIAHFNRSTLMGRGLGHSRHMRRKYAANYHYHAERRRGLTKSTDEHMPFLSQTGLGGFRSCTESNLNMTYPHIGQPQQLGRIRLTSSTSKVD